MAAQKIDRLSESQLRGLNVIRDEWLRIGLSTEPTDHPLAKKAITKAYECAGLTGPKLWVHLPNPLAGAVVSEHIICGSEWDQVQAQVGDQVRNQLRAQVWAQVGDQVWIQVWEQAGDPVQAQVGDQVREQVRAQVWAQVGDQVRNQVRAQVGDQVQAQVQAQVGDQVQAQVGAQVWSQVAMYGSHAALWLSVYDYFDRYCRLRGIEKVSGLVACAQEVGWWWPYEGLCIYTDRPTEIHISDMRLHRDGGPAVAYSGGFAVYALHGVRVPAWLACERDTHIDPRRLTEVRNAEVRREFVRKVGIDRVLHTLDAQVIDSEGDYELLGLDIGDGRARPYLKMLNPSIGTWHVEGVHPSCCTVQQAINFRRYGTNDQSTVDWQPEILT